MESPDSAAPVRLFGPTEYIRHSGPPNVYSASVGVAPWIVAPFVHVQNGNLDGTQRLSSTTIELNGVEVVHDNEFGQQVAVIERAVALAAQNTFVFSLTSIPEGRIFATVFGTNGDRTAPELTIAQPLAGALINNGSPQITLGFNDSVGAGEPAASGVVPPTLSVTVDGVDRTAAFTHTTGEASATLTLSEGPHAIEARIADVAGNVRTGSSSFRIDLTPPILRVVTPALNEYVPVATPAFRVEYQDDTSLAVDTLQVLINGMPGWSPLRAVDVRGAEHVQGSVGLRAVGIPDAPLYLAQHTADGWRLASGALTRDPDGNVATSLTPIGTIAPGAPLVVALVSPDDGITAPGIGDLLPAAQSPRFRLRRRVPGRSIRQRSHQAAEPRAAR